MPNRVWFCFALGLTLLAAGTVYAQEKDENGILAAVRARAQEQQERIRAMNYVADSKTTVTDSDGRLERTVTSRRRVAFVAPETVQADYLGMTVNGQALTPEQIAEEVKKSRSQRGQSPFEPQAWPRYRFTLAGQAEDDGRPVWKVAYQPVQPAEGLAVGYAFVDAQTFDVVRLVFEPSRKPAVMKSMQAEVINQPQGEWWVPAEFHLRMHVKVAFILTLADKQIEVQERYSNYQLSMHEEETHDQSF